LTPLDLGLLLEDLMKPISEEHVLEEEEVGESHMKSPIPANHINNLDSLLHFQTMTDYIDSL